MEKSADFPARFCEIGALTWSIQVAMEKAQEVEQVNVQEPSIDDLRMLLRGFAQGFNPNKNNGKKPETQI